MKNIMKRAWEIRKQLRSSMKVALRISWKIAKKENDLKNEWHRNDPDEIVRFRVWSNYGKVRAYYTCSWFSRYQNSKNNNFISLEDCLA